MTINKTQITGLCAGIILALGSLGANAAETAETESHLTQALKHTEAAVKADDTKAVGEHAKAANAHVKTSLEHLNAGSASLDQVIEHVKQGHGDLAKKAAEEAETHLKAAQ